MVEPSDTTGCESPHTDTHPEGVPEAAGQNIWHPFGVRSKFSRDIRWYRSAQPPANGFEPSGFTEVCAKVAQVFLSLNETNLVQWSFRSALIGALRDPLNPPHPCLLPAGRREVGLMADS